MTTFVQLHLLTSYPPANLNRDDLGRPKTAVMGGAQRLRISSQSLKRAWRTSSVFEEALSSHIGTRTKEMGLRVYRELTDGGVKEEDAKDWAQRIAGQFGKLKAAKKDKPLEDLEIEQLAHFSPEEIAGIDRLVKMLIKKKRSPKDDELGLLQVHHRAADIALFGRMLASAPAYNTEAACQVAHAITVHKAAVDDDYFTAVDDLNEGLEDKGSAHIGETGFAAGLFYLYLCIDRDLLIGNLKDDEDLANRTLRALAEAATTVAPHGKQSSFASRARASYVLAEKGTAQPRSLAVAFLKPVDGEDMLAAAITELTKTRQNMDDVYGPVAAECCVMDAFNGRGKLADLLDFVATPLAQ